MTTRAKHLSPIYGNKNIKDPRLWKVIVSIHIVLFWYNFWCPTVTMARNEIKQHVLKLRIAVTYMFEAENCIFDSLMI